MKKVFIVLMTTLCAFAFQAEARELKNISIQDALNSDDAKLGLPDDVKFYFGDAAPTGTVTKTIGTYTFDREINASLKSQISACHSALVVALKEFREAAKKEGATAVINIKSNAKGKAVSSKEIYACDSGMLKSGVSISGDLVVTE
ncbi:hypothetical protein [Cellvibrio sp.]|uniref:hypothetical protein n=1 Tax=Cellvibrio sp. TaxID=1965322 RepID=UPI00396476ED